MPIASFFTFLAAFLCACAELLMHTREQNQAQGKHHPTNIVHLLEVT